MTATTTKLLNLRSDTQTLPTPAMLAAIAAAPLGDDTYDEDPTVHALEARAAALCGKEAAMLLISGQMANLVAVMTHASPGDEVIVDADAHIFYYEVGALASVAGLSPMPVPSRGGVLDPEDVAAAIRPADLHFPRPRVLCLENTHNRSGGRVTPLAVHRRLCAVARARDLVVHLDGARIFNAAVAAGVSVRDYAADVDSLMFALTKGLSCPLGSLLVGSREFIDRADRVRRRLGGGMRQAGIIAAAGLVALDTMIDRLAEDHANARRLAEGLAAIPGLRVDLEAVETNMVYVDHSPSRRRTSEVLAAFKAHGVLASDRSPDHVRMVTHRHIDRDDVDEALRRIAAAMAELGAG